MYVYLGRPRCHAVLEPNEVSVVSQSDKSSTAPRKKRSKQSKGDSVDVENITDCTSLPSKSILKSTETPRADSKRVRFKDNEENNSHPGPRKLLFQDNHNSINAIHASPQGQQLLQEERIDTQPSKSIAKASSYHFEFQRKSQLEHNKQEQIRDKNNKTAYETGNNCRHMCMEPLAVSQTSERKCEGEHQHKQNETSHSLPMKQHSMEQQRTSSGRPTKSVFEDQAEIEQLTDVIDLNNNQNHYKIQSQNISSNIQDHKTPSDPQAVANPILKKIQHEDLVETSDGCKSLSGMSIPSVSPIAEWDISEVLQLFFWFLLLFVLYHKIGFHAFSSCSLMTA